MLPVNVLPFRSAERFPFDVYMQPPRVADTEPMIAASTCVPFPGPANQLVPNPGCSKRPAAPFTWIETLEPVCATVTMASFALPEFQRPGQLLAPLVTGPL